MADIVESVRRAISDGRAIGDADAADMADEIERLRAKNARLQELATIGAECRKATGYYDKSDEALTYRKQLDAIESEEGSEE